MLKMQGVKTWMKIIFTKNMKNKTFPTNLKFPLAAKKTFDLKNYEKNQAENVLSNEEKTQLYEKIIKNNNNSSDNNHNNNNKNNNNKNISRNNNSYNSSYKGSNCVRHNNGARHRNNNNDKRCHHNNRNKSNNLKRNNNDNKYRNNNNGSKPHEKRARNVRRNNWLKKCYTNNNACFPECLEQPSRRHSVIMNFSTSPCCDCVQYCFRPSLPPPPTYDCIQLSDHYLSTSCEPCVYNCDSYASQETYPCMYETEDCYVIPKYQQSCCPHVPQEYEEVEPEEPEEEAEEIEEDVPIKVSLREELMRMSEQQNLILEQQKCLQDQLIRQNEILENQGLLAPMVPQEIGELPMVSFNNANNLPTKKGAKTITLSRPPTGMLCDIKKSKSIQPPQLKGRFAECRV